MRNDFKPEPMKRLWPFIRSLEEFVDFVYNLAEELKSDKDTLYNETIEAF